MYFSKSEKKKSNCPESINFFFEAEFHHATLVSLAALELAFFMYQVGFELTEISLPCLFLHSTGIMHYHKGRKLFLKHMVYLIINQNMSPSNSKYNFFNIKQVINEWLPLGYRMWEFLLQVGSNSSGVEELELTGLCSLKSVTGFIVFSFFNSLGTNLPEFPYKENITMKISIFFRDMKVRIPC